MGKNQAHLPHFFFEYEFKPRDCLVLNDSNGKFISGKERHDNFHWKCCIPDIHQIEKLWFLGISQYKFVLIFWLGARRRRAPPEVPSSICMFLGRHFSSVSGPIGLSDRNFSCLPSVFKRVENAAKHRKNAHFRQIGVSTVRWSIDFSEISVFAVFGGVFCTFVTTLQTAENSGGIDMWARKQRGKGCPCTGTSKLRVAHAV